jgi:uncharacterized membrane protein YqjE
VRRVAQDVSPIRPDTADSRSLGELLSDVTEDFGRLVRQQIDLAKAEFKEQAEATRRAAIMLGAAAVAGLLVLVLLSFALVYALSEVMPAGWAALIVAVIWAVVAAVTFSTGRQRMKSISPIPHKTVQTVKEDVQWLQNPTE